MSEATEDGGLAPSLRFPEFTGKWQRSELGSLATILKGRGISKAEVDAQGSLSCIRYGELYTKYGAIIDQIFSKTNVPTDELFLSMAGDVLVPSSGETKEDIATAACVVHPGIAIGGDINVVRSIADGRWLSYYINGPLRANIAKVAQGDSVVHLYPNQLGSVRLFWPSEAEQRKIADCLQSLDELIALAIQKLDALKRYKKGLLQQLFPAEGESAPRLRFPQFHTSDWVQHQLDDLVTVSSGHTPSKANAAYWGGEMPWISAESMHRVRVSDSKLRITRAAVEDGAPIAKANSLLVLTRGSMLFKRVPICLAMRDLSFNQDVKCLRPRTGVLPRFLLQALLAAESSIPIDRTGIGAGKIDTDDLKRLPVPLPSVEEQKRVEECLQAIDDDIEAHQSFAEHFRTHKTALMQQLFPALDESEI